jgi:hypothetical protein
VAIVYGEMFESPIYPPFPGNYTKEKAKEIIKRRIQKKKSLTKAQRPNHWYKYTND